MHFEFLATYWWAVLAGIAAIVVGYVLVAGRSAQGGLGDRTKLGWSRWMELSRKAGNFQGRIVLTLFYFSLVAPFGLARTWLADPLMLKRTNQPRSWLPRQTRDLTLDDVRKQY